MYEQPESGMSLINFTIQILSSSHSINPFSKDLMARKPRNVRTERLTDWRFFFQIYLVKLFFHFNVFMGIYRRGQFIGLMMWPCAMSMWFLYMSEQGLRFYDVILVYNLWADGFHGFTIDQLTNFVNTGQCV
jgi:sodium/potassium-transporting ATPase subunit alpha